MPIVGRICPGAVGSFSEPAAPDFSAKAPNGYVIGSDIRIEYVAFKDNETNLRRPLTVKLIPFDSMDAKNGIALFENHVFLKENYRHVPECSVWVLNITRPIPINTLKVLKPSYNSLKVVIWNAKTAEVDHNGTDLYHFSPGIYLSDPNEGQSSSSAPIMTPGVDAMGTGAVKPPDGREIAKHGAVGICSGLGVIFVALVAQWLYLKFRKSKGGKCARGTWEEMVSLTSQQPSSGTSLRERATPTSTKSSNPPHNTTSSEAAPITT